MGPEVIGEGWMSAEKIAVDNRARLFLQRAMAGGYASSSFTTRASLLSTSFAGTPLRL